MVCCSCPRSRLWSGKRIATAKPRCRYLHIYLSTCLFIYMLSRRACLARWECLGPGTPWLRCARACTRCPSCSRPCSSWSQGSGRSSGSRPQLVLTLTISAPRYLLSLHMVERSGGCVVSEEVTYPELHRLPTYNTSKLNIYTSTHLRLYTSTLHLLGWHSVGLPGAAQARPGQVGGGRAEPLQVVPGGRRYRHGENTSRDLLRVT